MPRQIAKWVMLSSCCRSKKVSIPGNVVGRLSKSLTVINKMSGAHVEFEKADKKSGGDRSIIIRCVKYYN